MSKHIFIPDIQAKPGEPLNHCEWIGQYIVEKEPDKIINIGDHADMASLSTYDRKKLSFEGRRYKKDLEAAEYANSLLLTPLFNSSWYDQCETHMLLGNHEDRITRFVEDNPELSGFVDLEGLNYKAWYDKVHDFLVPVNLDGVLYAHYFYQPETGRPYGGMIETRIKNVGCTFTMGHQQGLKYGMRTLNNGTTQHGLIAGSCYLHYERYKGPQANKHWRGIVQKYGVNKGEYDAKFVNLDSLCQRYERMPLKQFMRTPDRHIGVGYD